MAVFFLYLFFLLSFQEFINASGFQTIVIDQKNFNQVRFINKPGMYIFSESIIFSEYEPALVIDSDNVTVDFGGNVLAAPEWLTKVGTRDHVGIRIEKQRNNVSITNGTINYFQDYGIDMSQNVNASITNMQLTNCKSYGVCATNVTASLFNNILLTDSGGSLVNLDSFCGFKLENISQSQFKKCSILGLDVKTSFTGFSIEQANENSFIECCSCGNSSPNNLGFYLFGGNQNTFTSLKVTQNTGSSDTKSFVCAFYIDEAEKYFNIKLSDFSYNSSQGGSVYGIKIGSTSTIAYPANGLIEENMLYSNFGGLVQYGLKDFSPLGTTTNGYFRNKASGQGQSFTSGSTLVDTGRMNYCIFIPDLNNIIKESSYTDQSLSSEDVTIKNISYYLPIN